MSTLMYSRIVGRIGFVDARDFNEADHPRSENGQFGAGGGHSVHEKQTPKFVGEFIKNHGNVSNMKAELANRETAHLEKALHLLKGHEDVGSNTVRSLINEELKKRGK